MKDIDRLIDSVFEGSGSDHSGLDRESMREVDLLTTLRSDLKSLRDVPECQLTTDHLRRAVLNQKPVSAKPRRNLWLWSPMAVAACVAMFFFASKPMQNVAQLPAASRVDTIVKPARNEGEVAKATAPADDSDLGLDDSIYVDGSSTDTDPQPTTGTTHRVRTRGTVVAKNDSGTVSGMVDAALTANKEMDSDKTDSGLAPTGRAESFDVATDKKSETTSQEPVVVVTERANSTTGAAEAKEVSKPSDVVFGG